MQSERADRGCFLTPVRLRVLRTLALLVWVLLGFGASPALAALVQETQALSSGGAETSRAETVVTPAAQRLVAIADIHGAYEELLELLRSIDLVDDHGAWIGGRAVLVQTGDFLDRGADVRAVMDLLRDLQDQAASAGGEVVVLMGNHEAMNVLGFLQDVSREAYADFAGPGSQELQRQMTKAHGKWLEARARAKRQSSPTFGSAEKQEFLASHPPGWFEYHEAVSPNGKYGAWLRGLPMVAERNGIVFLHGGISEDYVGQSIEELNQRVRDEIALMDRCRALMIDQGIVFSTADPNDLIAEGVAEIDARKQKVEDASPAERIQLIEGVERLESCLRSGDWFLVHQGSPIWYRGYARLPDEELAPVVSAALAGLGADRFAVGHTPQKTGEITSRLGGRVFLLDTGMLTSVYRGRASALEVVGGEVYALYPGRRVLLESASPPDKAPSGGPTGRAAAGASEHGGQDGEFQRVVGFRLIPPFDPAAPSMISLALSVPFKDSSGKLLGFANEDQLVKLLEKAPMTHVGKTATGVNRPLRMTLASKAGPVDAVFRSVDTFKNRFRTPAGHLLPFIRDSYRFEPAAYTINRMLGMERVPPAVLREWEGRSGSLQLWVHGVVDEGGRRKSDHQPMSGRAWSEQALEQILFDRLIGNVDRNLGNLLTDVETDKVWLIDHTRAFAELTEVEAIEKLHRCPKTIYRRLATTKEDALRKAMKPFLLDQETDTLWLRWRQMVEHFGALIEQHGESAVLFEPVAPSTQRKARPSAASGVAAF